VTDGSVGLQPRASCATFVQQHPVGRQSSGLHAPRIDTFGGDTPTVLTDDLSYPMDSFFFVKTR